MTAILDAITRDIRHGLRMLRRNPLFTAVALLTLAIGIGANTAVFSVVNRVVLAPLSYPHSDQLVSIRHKAPGAGGLASVSGDLPLSASMFVTYAEHNRTFQSIGIWNLNTATVTGLAEPEQVRVVSVSDGALQALAVPPVAGRWLAKDDQVPNGCSPVMLGYGYWQRRFGADPSAVGRNITINSRPCEIVGVMPQGFRFVDSDADIIVLMYLDRASLILPGFGYQCVARLKPGVTLAQASADIARLIPVWMTSWPAAPGVNPRVYENWRLAPALRPLKQDVVGNVAGVLWILMGTVGVVMLIASANVANLLLVRAESRQHELAVRAALGAGWGQIVQSLLVESVLLGLAGGALGLALADSALRLLVSIGPGRLPRLTEISIDTRTLWFTLAISLLSGLLFGAIPALKYAGPRISNALRGGGRSLSQSRERHRARNLLVIAQVALALVLLVSAGLMIRTFESLRTVQPGFTGASGIQLLRISIPTPLVPEPERVIRMQNDIADKLAAIPGVASVAFSSGMPMEGIPPNWDVIRTEERPQIGLDVPPVRTFQSISPGVFETLGTPFVAGRDITWTDLYNRAMVVIISENLARELWGSPSAAIGKRLADSLPAAPWREVIGVVADVRYNGVQEPAPTIVYWPTFREGMFITKRLEVARTVTFAIRTDRAGSESLIHQASQAVWNVNPSLPVASVQTLENVFDQSLARTSFTLVMLGIASAMALVLGIVGIYGVISYVVSQRRREIGIRLALGAQPAELKRMFVRHGLTLAGIGVAIGLGAAALAMRLMKSLLFGISPLDPVTYIAVPLILIAAAALATWLPARRAARVDPVHALRND